MMHTPGPWTIEPIGDRFLQIRGKQFTTALVTKSEYAGKERKDGWERDKYTDVPNAEANARLIAAAPELLSALQEIVHDVLRGNGGNDCIEGAERIIAKATGAA